jgi:hypothetical protein
MIIKKIILFYNKMIKKTIKVYKIIIMNKKIVNKVII